MIFQMQFLHSGKPRNKRMMLGLTMSWMLWMLMTARPTMMAETAMTTTTTPLILKLP